VTAVWILEDHDDDGHVRCQGIARSCTRAGIRAQIVRLPGLPPKGDVSDWLDAGHTKEELLAECLAAPVSTPETTTQADEAPLEDLQLFLSRRDQQPPLGWRVPGLVPDEGICLWHGQPRDFKSMCAQALDLAMAANVRAFNLARFTPAGHVIVAYFTEEDPERLFAARLHWLTAKQEMPRPRSFFPFIRKGVSFDMEGDRAFILAKLRQTKADVVIFDPVRSYTGQADKGPPDLRLVAVFLRKIQNTTTGKNHPARPPRHEAIGDTVSRGAGPFAFTASVRRRHLQYQRLPPSRS
jgi:hypothetical protein